MKKFLAEWATHYFKHKDILTEKIDRIEDKDFGLLIINKDGSEKTVLAEPFLSEFKSKLANLDKKEIVFVVFNSKDNFNAMINEWAELIKFEKLSIIFVNPFSMTDIKWIVSPFFHNRIADPVSLKSGLKSLFSAVEDISKEEAQKKIK